MDAYYYSSTGLAVEICNGSHFYIVEVQLKNQTDSSQNVDLAGDWNYFQISKSTSEFSLMINNEEYFNSTILEQLEGNTLMSEILSTFGTQDYAYIANW